MNTAFSRTIAFAALMAGFLTVGSPRLDAQQPVPQPQGAAVGLLKQVVSSGAVASGGTGLMLRGTVGQTVIGEAAGAAAQARFGFWAPPSKVVAGMERNGNSGTAPADLALRAYPNPFAVSALLSWTLPQKSDVQLEIVDELGRIVRRISSGEQDAGHHFVRWDGRAADGSLVASGWYRAVLAAQEIGVLNRVVRVRTAALHLHVAR